MHKNIRWWRYDHNTIPIKLTLFCFPNRSLNHFNIQSRWHKLWCFCSDKLLGDHICACVSLPRRDQSYPKWSSFWEHQSQIYHLGNVSLPQHQTCDHTPFISQPKSQINYTYIYIYIYKAVARVTSTTELLERV